MGGGIIMERKMKTEFVCSQCDKPLTQDEIDSDQCNRCHNISKPETDSLCKKANKS